jgi:hypothetical protein
VQFSLEFEVHSATTFEPSAHAPDGKLIGGLAASTPLALRIGAPLE